MATLREKRKPGFVPTSPVRGDGRAGRTDDDLRDGQGSDNGLGAGISAGGGGRHLGQAPGLRQAGQGQAHALSLGLRDALNLDGGSSTALVLGGVQTVKGRGVVAAVHNGLGLIPRVGSPLARP